MATLENITDLDELQALLEKMDGPELIAQHLVQRGSIFALETLLKLDVSAATVELMLVGLRSARDRVAACAVKRGVQLVSED